jgi:electron transfer flavoprotein alpha subunit
MHAIVPVRGGLLPLGALETVAECGGNVVLAGSGVDATTVAGVARDVTTLDLGDFQPARWAAALAPIVAGSRVIVLPASPDGRDLAPRLAHTLGRPLLAGAVAASPEAVSVSRGGGLALHDFLVDEPVVVTLQPGIRGVLPVDDGFDVTRLDPPDTTHGDVDPALVELLPPDVATMDLSEATRIVGGGAGLDRADRVDQLAAVAAGLGAAMGATRVITDRGWVGHERQIGTTGVVVDPSLYLAFGISGAVQHTAGLGDPDHIVSVNIDPHCPMMQMSDLAVVSDANAVLDELQQLLSSECGAIRNGALGPRERSGNRMGDDTDG